MLRLLPLLAVLALALAVSGCSLGQPTQASSITEDSATLEGDVFSNEGGEVTYWFEYGTTTEYGTKTPDRTVTFADGHRAEDPPISVSEAISGLEPGTTYRFRMCTSPGLEEGSRGCVPQDRSFTTMPAPQTLVDTSVADFAAGTVDADGYVGATGAGDDGEVLLRPAVGEEFGGDLLPSGWFSAPWADGGAATVGSGTLTLDGARAGTVATFGPGRTLEFVGSFSGAPFQHLGFGESYEGAPWAMFSTKAGDGLYARTNAATQEETQIAGVTATDPHRYRIVWTATGVEYLVDGTSVATHAIAVGSSMRPLGSDFEVGGGAATWHWTRMSPYASASTFTSRVLDSNAAGSDWMTLEQASATPAGTALAIETRSGGTAIPDGSWSEWQALGAGGAIESPDGRYLQYRVALSTSDDTRTPILERATVRFRPPAGP